MTRPLNSYDAQIAQGKLRYVDISGCTGLNSGVNHTHINALDIGLGLANSIFTASLSAKVDNNAAKQVAATQQQLSATKIVSTYVGAQQDVATAKKNLTTANTELAGLEQQLKDFDKLDDKKTEIKNKISELKKNNGTAGSDGKDITNAKLKAYNDAVTNKAKYEKVQPDIQKADNDIQSADTIINSFPKSMTCSGRSAATIQIGKDGSYSLPGDDFYKTEDGKDITGADQAKARDKANAEALAKQVKDAIAQKDKAKADKTKLLTSVGLQPGDDISTKISDQQKIIDTNKDAKTVDGSDKASSITDYSAQLEEYEQELKDLDNLKKSDIEGKISTKKTEIEKLKKQLESAMDAQSVAEKAYNKLKAQGARVAGASSEAESAKANYKASLNDKAHGTGKRTWLQKLFGTNKTANAKQLKKDYKAALAKANQYQGYVTQDEITQMYQEMMAQRQQEDT